MVKIGVFGGRRGDCMIEWCKKTGLAKVVAICDRDETVIEALKTKYPEQTIEYDKDFDVFIGRDFDGVVLANYANEHAPYAIKAFGAGKHVLSEVLPFETLKEGVELVEAAEKSDRIYAYAENYCFMPAPREMRKLYREGKLGEFEYGEGEYIHNCEPIWADITYGDKTHWRNRMYANFYCTHSLGPLIHITGMRPISVTGFELPFNDRAARMGLAAGSAGIEMVTLENGAVVKSMHGNLDKNSIRYCIYGSKGRAESAIEDAENGGVERIYTNLDEREGIMKQNIETYLPKDALSEKADGAGHGSSDYYVMYNFISAIEGDKTADNIGIYEACDMFLPGMFAYFSVLDGGKPQTIPDFRNKSERDKYRNDTRCTDPQKSAECIIPSYGKGKIEIPDEIYQGIRLKYLKNLQEKRK